MLKTESVFFVFSACNTADLQHSNPTTIDTRENFTNLATSQLNNSCYDYQAHLGTRMDSSKQLEVWYGSLNPLKVDLVGDFAGKELFAIHGEALMLHCIAQARVDFCSEFTFFCLPIILSTVSLYLTSACRWFPDSPRRPRGRELPLQAARPRL